MVLTALPGLANWIDQDTGLQASLIKLALHLLHPAPETRLGGPKKPLGEGVHLGSGSELSAKGKKAAVWPSALLACISKAP